MNEEELRRGEKDGKRNEESQEEVHKDKGSLEESVEKL